MGHLYLMRHGQTQFNVEHRVQGWCDSPLTEKGIEDAKAASRYWAKQGIVFDHAYTSTQERASDTLELIVDMPYKRLKGLREWGFGVFEGQPEILNPKHPDTDTYEDFFAEHGYGGERGSEVRARITQTLTEIMQQPNHEHVIVVSHAGAMYNFLLGIVSRAELGDSVPLANLGTAHLTYDDAGFHLIEVIDVLA